MSVRVRFPDLEHWKAQVKCQIGCPVSTDAGRYVQLIAEGRDEDAYLVARAPNPFASVCGRVCAAPCEDACRRGSIDAPISIRALKRYVTEQLRRRVDASRHPGPPARPCWSARATATPATCRCCRWWRRQPSRRRRAPLPQGRGDRRRAGRPVGRARPGAARLRRHGLRGRRGARRHDALRHSRVPPAAHPHPRRDRQDPGARRDPAPRHGRSIAHSASPSCGATASRRCSSRSASPRAATCRFPASSSTAWSRRSTTCSTSTAATASIWAERVVVIGGGFVAFDAARTALRLGREVGARQSS